ncbi:hypothetical protein [Streptomyces sp. N2A]|uniref:hypothetical protein n=1 Tax=Streptomyces sp. N2A TaxID=3073936 RepID=UPI00286FBAA6|nr:hypothetical protein [Streptomyces sp. N2A]
MRALHLRQSALVHVNTPLLQQVLAEPAWARKLTDEDRCGLTALVLVQRQPVRHLPPGNGQAAGPGTGRRRAPPRTATDDADFELQIVQQ